MKVISLNVRGLGGDIKWKYIKELIGKEKPGIMCAQETKLISVSASKCFGLWGVMTLVGFIEGLIVKVGAY